MGLFGRRIKPPAQLRKALGPDERFLALADDGAATIAATQVGLWLPVADVAVGWRRVDWDLVVKATWTDAGLALVEGTVDSHGIVTDLPTALIRPAEPRNLPAVVRARVEHSIGRWEQLHVPGGTGRIVGRRRAGVDGLRWTGRLDTGTPDTTEARAVLVDYLERIAALPPESLVEY
ncbi:MAG: hypothetical protein M3Y42_02160 [Actinomycetota bacterium]|nr:hypothetical protein [Actinomycetota bacterium]MDQ2955750.1 hypothetical protein [Actinomycetota bacterium]